MGPDNGGYSSHLKDLCRLFDDQTKYPWAYFKESQAALDGALTCVGIILPDHIYETAKLTDIGKNYVAIDHNEIIIDSTIAIQKINVDIK